jgi:hypothetical protein
MNAAHSITPQVQAFPQPEAQVERQGPREIGASPTNHLSPALLLQSRLEVALENEQIARWPGYVRLPLILGSAAGVWGLILTAAFRIFH